MNIKLYNKSDNFNLALTGSIQPQTHNPNPTTLIILNHLSVNPSIAYQRFPQNRDIKTWHANELKTFSYITVKYIYNYRGSALQICSSCITLKYVIKYKIVCNIIYKTRWSSHSGNKLAMTGYNQPQRPTQNLQPQHQPTTLITYNHMPANPLITYRRFPQNRHMKIWHTHE